MTLDAFGNNRGTAIEVHIFKDSHVCNCVAERACVHELHIQLLYDLTISMHAHLQTQSYVLYHG